MRTDPFLRFGPVRCGASDEKAMTSPTFPGTATASGTSSRHLKPDRRQPVFERAALVHAGRDPWATVLLVDIDQRYPEREILLRLDEGVAIVLVPGKFLFLARLLVDRLVPIEPHVVADQVVADVLDLRMRREGAQYVGPGDKMRREGDDVGFGDADLAALAAQPFFALLFDRIDGDDDAFDFDRCKHVFEFRETFRVERLILLDGQITQTPAVPARARRSRD